MKKKLLLILTLFLSNCGDGKIKTINDDFPTKWREPSDREMISIGRTLAKNGIKGCGEYYIRKSNDRSETPENGTFLVGCTGDGIYFTYYIVWVQLGKVSLAHDEHLIKSPFEKEETMNKKEDQNCDSCAVEAPVEDAIADSI